MYPVQWSFIHLHKLFITIQNNFNVETLWDGHWYLPPSRNSIETAYTTFKPTVKQGFFIHIKKFHSCIFVSFWIISQQSWCECWCKTCSSSFLFNIFFSNKWYKVVLRWPSPTFMAEIYSFYEIYSFVFVYLSNRNL